MSHQLPSVGHTGTVTHSQCPSLPAWPGPGPSAQPHIALGVAGGCGGHKAQSQLVLPVQQALPQLCCVLLHIIGHVPGLVSYCTSLVRNEELGVQSCPLNQDVSWTMGHLLSQGSWGEKGRCLGTWLQWTALKEHT